jgi:ADP-ribosyl-[dinitrogen reductase] hydrolase
MDNEHNTPDQQQSEARDRYAARLQRARGCWLGQLAGDALGSMVEFRSIGEISRQYPGGLREIGPSPVWDTIPGQPTDDSEMALALARSILSHDYDVEAAARAYGEWRLSEPFDIGNTTRQATDAIAAAMPAGESASEAARRAANTHSEANGALMRQSPLGIWGSWLEPEALDRYVRADTALTHPNQVCQDASAAFIVALAAAIRDGLDGHRAYDVALAWDRTHGSSPTVTGALEAAADRPPDYQPSEGHVLIALQNAFYQALHAPTLEEGVVATVMGGGDTDTNAAIAGALLGAIHCVGAVPEQWREAVLNCRPEEGKLGVSRPRPDVYWPADAMELAERLLEKGIGAKYREERRNDPRTTEELIGQALSAGSEDDAYWDAVTIIWGRANPETLHRARQLCASPDAAERELGAIMLGQLGERSDVMHEERFQALLTLLQGETKTNVLASACMALGHLHDERANESIMRLKSHPSEDVRYAVAVSLKGDLDEAAIATLIELSADEDSDVRDWSTFRLRTGENTSREVLDALAARVTDEDDDTRAEAIVGLARNKDQRALEPLIANLDILNVGDQDWSDRIEGLLYEAARELADPRLCPVLVKIKSTISDDEDLDEALEKCGCETQ